MNCEICGTECNTPICIDCELEGDENCDIIYEALEAEHRGELNETF